MKIKNFQAKPLKDQTIVITGASSGIGLATAILAAKQGANVVMASRNLEAMERTAWEFNTEKLHVLAVETDVSHYEEVMNLREVTLATFGHIDTWINNAGKSIYGSLIETPLSEEKQLFETNFWGVRHGCRVAVYALRKSGGVLINMGSEVSARAIPLQGMYSASKHAVKAYTDSLRMELEKDDIPIAVCLIRPTAINTPFTEHAANYLDVGEPSLPSPTYHPNVVAKAILSCAEYPQRDVYVGGSARFFHIMDTFFPRIADSFMKKIMFDNQTRGTKVPHEEEQEALNKVPEKEGEVVGKNRGRMRNFSLYTALTQMKNNKHSMLEATNPPKEGDVSKSA